MEPIHMICDKSCGQNVYVKHLKVAKLHNSIEKTYFNCPNCSQEYVCFYTDKSIRKLQSKMRELHRKMKWAKGDELEPLVQEETKLKQSIANDMASVKREVEQREP